MDGCVAPAPTPLTHTDRHSQTVDGSISHEKQSQTDRRLDGRDRQAHTIVHSHTHDFLPLPGPLSFQCLWYI